MTQLQLWLMMLLLSLFEKLDFWLRYVGRYLKCWHSWETFERDDLSWSSRPFKCYGVFRHNARYVKICRKCGEAKSSGYAPSEKW